MTDLSTTIDTHLEAYGEPNPDRRRRLLEQAWSNDGRLIDPPLEGTGRAGISEAASHLQAAYPGHTFRRTSGVDEHHGFARYEWDLVATDGTVAVHGLDVAEVGSDGLLLQVVGFLGPLPGRES